MANTTRTLQLDSMIQDAISKKQTDFRQLIASILAIITLTISVVLWATSAHADIKDWTAGQDYVTREELKDTIKEQYVPRVEFVIVKSKLDNLTEKHDTLISTIEKMNTKLDSLEGGSKRKGK